MDEIGKTLKEARIEKGYTLDDLQQITKIQKRYLQAIEEGDTDILPGRFYARAFVKQYADIVGLDGEELLEETLSITPEEASEEFAENVNKTPARTHDKGKEFLDSIKEYIPMILIFILVSAILVVIFIAFRQGGSSSESKDPIIKEDDTEVLENTANDDTDKSDDEKSDEEDEENNAQEDDDEEDEEDEEEQEVSVVESTGATTTYEIKGVHPEKQTLSLTATGGDSWVSVTVSGGEGQTDTLTDGKSMNIEFDADTEEINIVIGNAPVTKVTLNDKEIEYTSEAADIVRQDWTLRFAD